MGLLDSKDNPYMNLISMMRDQGGKNNPVPFLIGKIISASPLLIQAGNIQLEREDVLINELLLKEYKRMVHIKAENMDGDTSDSVKKDFELKNIDLYESEIETKEDDFKKGDQVVLLMSADQQQFILFCKVR